MKNLFLILLCLTMIACGVNALIKKEYTYDKRFVKGEGYYNKEGKKEGVWKEYRFNDNGVFRKEFEALYGNGERMTFIGSYLNGRVNPSPYPYNHLLGMEILPVHFPQIKGFSQKQCHLQNRNQDYRYVLSVLVSLNFRFFGALKL